MLVSRHLDRSRAIFLPGLLLAALLAFPRAPAPAGGAAAAAPTGTVFGVSWTRQFGTVGANHAYSVAADQWGYVYVVGFSIGDLFDPSNPTGSNSFLRKYDSEGNTVWTQQVASATWDYTPALALDGAGDIYIGGYTYNPLDGQVSSGDYDAFLRKYDPSGNTLWTRQFGTDRADYARGLAVDSPGNAWIAGYTLGTFPGQTRTGSGGDYDAFVRKYDSSGNALWTNQFGTPFSDGPSSVAIDAAGNAYVVGTTNGALAGPIYDNTTDAYIRKYDTSGNVLWTRQFGTPDNDYLYGAAVDATGNLYVAGFTSSALPGQTFRGLRDAFVQKYDGLGNELWTREFGTAGVDLAYALTVDGSGNAYVVGRTNGAFPGQSPSGDYDVYVAKYDSAGNLVGLHQSGSANADYGYGVAVDRAGNVYVVGKTEGAFAGQVSAGSWDAFIFKLSQGPGPLPSLTPPPAVPPDFPVTAWARQFGTAADDFAEATAVDGAENVYVAGYTYGAFPGFTYGGWGASDAFVRKYNNLANVVWTRQYSFGGDEKVKALAADAQGAVYAAGEISSTAFLRKYGPDGDEIWTRQFGAGSGSRTGAAALALDTAGNALVAGYTYGAFPGQNSGGSSDIFVRKYDASGNEVWTRQFGGSGADIAWGVAADGAGNVYVAGGVNGVVDWYSDATDALVLKYDPSGNLLWSRQFGSPLGDNALAVAADSAGNCYVAGYTMGALPGHTSLSPADAFLRKYDSYGYEQWTDQFATLSGATARGLAVDAAGNVYLAGSTNGTFPYQNLSGGLDAFVREYDPSGNALWTYQFGTEGNDSAKSIVIDRLGNIYLSGTTTGRFLGQTPAGNRDGFVAKYLRRPLRPGDVNRDGVVDRNDILSMAGAFNQAAGREGYSPLADLNGDGIVDIFDLALVGRNYGR